MASGFSRKAVLSRLLNSPRAQSAHRIDPAGVAGRHVAGDQGHESEDGQRNDDRQRIAWRDAEQLRRNVGIRCK